MSELPEGTVLKDGLPFQPNGEPLVRRGYGTRLVSYVAGRGWERYPDGVGRFVPVGSYIEFNLHHQASGRPEREQSQFGIWLSRAPIEREMINVTSLERGTTMVEDRRLEQGERVPNIPPMAENWKISKFMLFPEPATLYALSSHMHLRGKDMKFILTYPDGHDELVLDVPNYDFTWQTYYELETPLKIPAGSKLTSIDHYDNSPRNRWNPAPEKEVFWTEQSWDEMYNPQIRYTWDRQNLTRDEPAR